MLAPTLLQHAHGSLHFIHGGHAGRENHGLFRGRARLQQLVPKQLIRPDLEERYVGSQFLNRLQTVIKSSNLGDNRTLAIPVAHTIYYEMGAERRASMGIDDSLIRISVGIEEPEDLLSDFEQALIEGR